QHRRCEPAARRRHPRVFDEVYAASTLGIFLREFIFGHANQLAAVGRAHLVGLAARVPLLPGIEQRAFIDIDSLLRPVYGHHKQGASFGHAKIASRALLWLGLSPQITTLSTAQACRVAMVDDVGSRGFWTDPRRSGLCRWSGSPTARHRCWR